MLCAGLLPLMFVYGTSCAKVSHTCLLLAVCELVRQEFKVTLTIDPGCHDDRL